jgi:hypothetical protein
MNTWRREELGKVEDQLKHLKEEYDANIRRETKRFSIRHDELETLLVAATSRRLMIEDLIVKLTLTAPSSSKEARAQRKEKKVLEKELKDQVHEIDSLNDQLNNLAIDFRKTKIKLQERLEKEKRFRRSQLKKRIDARLKSQKKKYIRAQKKWKGKHVPVQMQCRVLVAGNKFSDTLSIHEQHVKKEAFLSGSLQGKSELYENHKERMANIMEAHEEEVEKIMLSHEEKESSMSAKLDELKADKYITEEQLRVLEDACNRQKNALLQELGEKRCEKHMSIINRIKNRKKKAKEEKKELTVRASAEDWSADQLDNAVAAVMENCSHDVNSFIKAIEKDKGTAHDRLLDRLSKVKEKEAKSVIAAKSKKGSQEHILKSHELAQQEIDAIMADENMDKDIVTDEMLSRLLNVKIEELEAFDHLQNHPDHSDEDVLTKIELLKKRSATEMASLRKLVDDNHKQKRLNMLQRLAARKQKEAVEITGAINLAHITGISKGEVEKQIESIKKKSEEDSATLMKHLGMIADKKHKRLMDRIANLKAQEIHKV